ncbi:MULTISPECIES: ligase-associated DNA damage response endonuclease PdeM [unclassified Flavobacterium]|uniref:ligase-associated DNA damage response endonuclease PdeM n=1 Tax=unclassified Flavobacterium TaxID=196869 RepID=UPI001F1354F0|nr:MULTISPECIES: ligase-associated DNA damage response endonuclease PdeM [unclassified Flavobacterium]UMY66775.1 ligase-associated DNA damage response endonuclease PdeM [Flavobacterium sp. HJ-32-4]
MTIVIDGHHFELHCSGAMLWRERRMLLISDVHIGKVSHFRQHGVAIPPVSAEANFRKLAKVVDHFQPETILFLGDLFHSRKNREWQLFEDWISGVDARVVLVEGNHDVIARRHYDELGVVVCEELVYEGFLFTHHPTNRDGYFNFAGHIHPGIVLRSTGRTSLRLACYFRRGQQLILPAFGEFTGKYTLEPEEGDAVWVVTKEAVLQVFGAASGS